MRWFSISRTLSVMALLTLGLLTAHDVGLSQSIRGSVQNLSRGQPAASDDVILVRLEQTAGGMRQEAEAHAKTDAQGSFLVPVLHRDRSYLLRVVHQGVTYDAEASPGDNVSISVFDVAPKVSAIAGSLEILRIGSRPGKDQRFLHVSDMYEIRNESSPPMTQAGGSTFEVYLPANAKVDSVLAAGPGAKQATGREAGQDKVGQMISATAVASEPGHYTVSFPLRPGATRFAFNYDVPYSAHITFETRHEYGFQQFAVMTPATMRFSSPSSAFQMLATGDRDYQVEAVMHVTPGKGPGFEISENRRMPLQSTEQPHAQFTVSPNSTLPGDTRSAEASPSRSDTKSGRTPPLWPWQALAGGLLLACVFLLLRLRTLNQRPAVLRATSTEQHDSATVAATSLKSLKEELFQLEVNRARGFISPEEYSSTKQALRESLDRVGDDGCQNQENHRMTPTP